MGLFDNVLNNLGAGAGAEQSGQTAGLAGPVLELLSNREGGISGLVQSFEQNGLSHIVSSWIGSGANLPISTEQVQQVLGSEHVEALAEKAGISPGAASSQLAELLPGIIDKLTPNGEVPKTGDLTPGLSGLLQTLVSKFDVK